MGGGKRYGVSIPHRYGKNVVIWYGISESCIVSIPHRYGKNKKLRDGIVFIDEGFHSS